MEVLHRPVLVREVIGYLGCGNGGVYVDCTVGEGGHSEAILRAAAPDTRVIGLDRDAGALAVAGERLAPFGVRVTLRHASFAALDRELRRLGVGRVSGILFDLGMSSRQVDDPLRGFSFQKAGPLDMRMDQGERLTADEIVNQWAEEDLTRIFREFGEERWARRIGRAIVRRRLEDPIRSTTDLARVVQEAVPARFRRYRIHPATRVFQALRIATNDEINALRTGLQAAIAWVRQGGRIVVISFHSIEDRIIKQTFREMAASQVLKILTKRPIAAGEAEISENPRSRSAKLRAAERCDGTIPAPEEAS